MDEPGAGVARPAGGAGAGVAGAVGGGRGFGVSGFAAPRPLTGAPEWGSFIRIGPVLGGGGDWNRRRFQKLTSAARPKMRLSVRAINPIEPNICRKASIVVRR